MKKFLPVILLVLLFAVLAFVVALVVCPVPYSFAQSMDDLANIQIEIVNLECEMGYWAGSAYDEDNVTVIAILENDEKESFISEFQKIKNYQPIIGSRIDVVCGRAIRIIYSDGQIELITSYGTARVTNGKITNFTTTFEADPFHALLDKYSGEED